MLDWIGLLVVIGFVTLVLILYMLITRSAGIYSTSRHFWKVLLISAGFSYLLSGSLFLVLHLNTTIAVAVSAIVPFLVGNLDLGEKAGEKAADEEGGDLDEEEADQEESDEGDAAMIAADGNEAQDTIHSRDALN
jgi:hypothetical protein